MIHRACGAIKCPKPVVIEIDGKLRYFDKCIASEIEALRSLGICTLSSCCGHGFWEPWFTAALKDKEQLIQMGFVWQNDYFLPESAAKLGHSDESWFILKEFESVHLKRNL